MIRSVLLVAGAPLAIFALSLGLWLQTGARQREAEAVATRLAHALSHPAPAPVAEGVALLVPGATPGLAGAALQSRVRSLAAESGAEVLQLESAAPEAAPPLARLPLTLHLRATEPQVAALIQALETARPLIRIDRLDLRGEGQEAGVLDATLALSAWSAEVKP